jgi:hypothetical protein
VWRRAASPSWQINFANRHNIQTVPKSKKQSTPSGWWQDFIGHSGGAAGCASQQNWRPMSQMGLGCVKTPTPNFCVERLSRLRRIRKEPLWGAPSKEEKRENNSAILRVCTFSHSLGQQQTCRPRNPTFSFEDRTSPTKTGHVGFVPSADLLNHLVGDSPDQTRLLMFSVAD